MPPNSHHHHCQRPKAAAATSDVSLLSYLITLSDLNIKIRSNQFQLLALLQNLFMNEKKTQKQKTERRNLSNMNTTNTSINQKKEMLGTVQNSAIDSHGI